MAEYTWPKQGEAAILGHDQDRIDGLAKATGAAKYTYDINVDKMLVARMLGCPHAHCKITAIDTSAAEKVRGVVAVKTMKKVDDEIMWQGDPIACVAAETEGAAAEGVDALKVEYEMLDVFVDEENLAAAEAAKRTKEITGNVQLANEPGDDDNEEEFEQQELDRVFGEAAAVVEGYYGIEPISHMCLEPHGSTCEWKDNKLLAHLSTQNVSFTAPQFAGPLNITTDEVTVQCDYVGGGFGCKFSVDAWGVVCAQISKETGRPVKLMLTRDQELKVAGNRPSGFLQVKVGANADGIITAWDSHHWGTAGAGGGGIDQGIIPYVFDPPNRRRRQTEIATNTAPQAAWRAPGHPQACAITQTAIDDLAHKLGMDSYDVFMRNLDTVPFKKKDVYAAEMETAAKLMDWKAKWHLHGKGPADGAKVSGLGMALHMWGGAGHDSTCLLRIHPDGGVETALGSQDIGTGTRTVIAMVVAESLGLPVNAIKVKLGSSIYPVSGPSGGSTTVAGVAESNRRACQDALTQIFKLVGAGLKVDPDTLEAKAGKIQVKDNAKKSMTWKQACGLLKMKPLEVKGSYSRMGNADSKLSSDRVGGVQMAEVEVDKETGQVRVKKFVAVQDVGLVINPKTAKSQIYGAVIMGIAYSLFEERIMDKATGAYLNCEVADYKLPRLGDIGEIVIELFEPPSEYGRGVVGLGEPPVISPGAAISNAVANALGVRVPVLPMTPPRVLEAIMKGGNA